MAILVFLVILLDIFLTSIRYKDSSRVYASEYLYEGFNMSKEFYGIVQVRVDIDMKVCYIYKELVRDSRKAL